MPKNEKNVPLFTTFKRFDFPRWKGIVIRIGAVVASLIISLILCTLVIGKSPIQIFDVLIEGAFIRPWKLALDTALLLGFGIAIVPTFRMKYWNMGANGQVLVGLLVSIVIMFYGKSWVLDETGNIIKSRNTLLIISMLAASLVASIIWAVIPCIFKAFFNTNETLFTLMMNYIASTLVAYVNYSLAKGKQESPGVINYDNHTGWINSPINEYFIPVLVIVLITVIIYIYMEKTKHGYETIVLGDSINTAKYVGMNTNKIMIRTLILNGAICGVLGFLYASAINHSMSADSCGSLGFTAVLVAWLSNFNPIIMLVVSFMLAFLTLGTSNISTTYRLGSNNLSNVIIGLIFFAILISEFFIRYKLKVNVKIDLKEKIKSFFNKIKDFFKKIINKFKKDNKEKETK